MAKTIISKNELCKYFPTQLGKTIHDDDSSEEKGIDHERIDNNNKDLQFMKQLQKAKQEKLGSIAPLLSKQEQEQIAQSAENTLLQAMQQVKQEFKNILENEVNGNVDEAIDIVKSQWDQEDKLLNDMEDENYHGEFE